MNNQLHLDSANFDPKKYISSFLKNNTIKDLIKKNNEIEEEIKIHDHEIQSLVFENYTKFISSIDTVKQMKTDISKVDAKLQTLDESMEKIATLAVKIDSTFSVKRKEIQKLDTINKDLQKLKNLCEFPDVLKTDLQQYKAMEKNLLSGENRSYESLFQTSVSRYRQCFSTLNEFKTEPLIAPIYKQSISKVQQIRSMLWNLQSQFKPSKNNSKDLRSITLKYITVTEEHITPLRTFFKKAKDKFSDNCLVPTNFTPLEAQFSENDVEIAEIRAQNRTALKSALDQRLEAPLINEPYWADFEEDFRFIFKQMLPLCKISQEIEQVLNTPCKQIFNFVLSNFLDNLQKNWVSSLYFSLTLDAVSKSFKKVIEYATPNLKKEFSTIIEDKFSFICEAHLNWTFVKLKTAVLHRLLAQKRKLALIKPGEVSQNDIFDMINPIKAYLSVNYCRVLVGLSNINQQEYFKDPKHFNSLIVAQTEGYFKLIFYLLSVPSLKMSEEVFLLLNSSHAKSLPLVKKQVEQNICKEIASLSESGTSYIFNHSLLAIVQRTLISRVFEDWFTIYDFTKNIEFVNSIEKENVKACVASCTKAIASNTQNLCLYYLGQIESFYLQNQAGPRHMFPEILKLIEQFIEVTGQVFPDNRRSVPKKPSFLSLTEKSYTYDTEIMIAKKTHLFEKKDTINRPTLFSSFVKGLFKNLLRAVRSGEYPRSVEFDQEVYCIGQLAYQITSVDEESLVAAFFYLIRNEFYRGEMPKLDRGALDTAFSGYRSKAKL